MTTSDWRNLVVSRAGDRCEYCYILQLAIPFLRFHIEHIVARQHGGSDEPDNLALACGSCNRYKGPNLTAVDPSTGRIVQLYHPRTFDWSDHFSVTAFGEVVGLTEVGRATVRLLRMNEPQRLELRITVVPLD